LQLRHNGRCAVEGVTVTALLLVALMGPIRGPLVLFPYGLLALWLGWCWRRRLSWWLSWSMGLLIGAAGFLVRVAVLSVLLGENLWVVITTAAAQLLERLAGLLQLGGGPDLLQVQPMALALVLLQNLIYVLALHAVALWIFARLQSPISDPPALLRPLPPSIRFEPGSRYSGDPALAERRCAGLRRPWLEANQPLPQVVLVLAGTDTAAVPGISAAGATPAARQRTAAADAELLLLGPDQPRPHALPPLPAGVSPALIAHVVVREFGLDSPAVDLGVPVAPALPHLRFGQGPARCLQRRRGDAIRNGWRSCWRGGAAGGSAWRPLACRCCWRSACPGARRRPRRCCRAGGGGDRSGERQPEAGRWPQGRSWCAAAVRRAAQLGPDPAPEAVLAAVGDPMQALVAGVLLGAAAAAAPLPLLLAGGSQMAAVLALALALAPAQQRPALLAQAALGTTAWVAGEASSDLGLLLERIAGRWGQAPLAFACGLRFSACTTPELLAYEQGYVKEGWGPAVWPCCGS
jgi:NaMN:DMB phosphoribosyltransferase